MIVNFLKSNQIPTVITLHDCWYFTGRCSHFVSENCYKWQKGCYKCPNLRLYPKSYVFDLCRGMYSIKKELFTNFEYLQIVAVSKWLEQIAKQSSIFKGCHVTSISNGIDLEIFFPRREGKFAYLKNDSRKIILAAASQWNKQKGLEVILRLTNVLDLAKFKIVVVGNLPHNFVYTEKLVLIERLESKDDMAQLMSVADILINPSMAETFGLVNVEAQACGTPVVSFDNTAIPETINSRTGIVVPNHNEEAFVSAIISVSSWEQKHSSECVANARKYSSVTQVKRYLDMYDKIVK